MNNEVRIGWDAAPLTGSQRWFADLNGRQFAAATLPPLQDVATIDAYVDDGRTWDIHLAAARWSDGEPLIASEVARGIATALRHPSRRIARLTGLSADECGSTRLVQDGSDVRVIFPRRVGTFPHLATTVQTSPARSGRDAAGLGPFIVSEPQRLTRPHGWRREDRATTASFVVTGTGADAIDQLHSGRIDVLPSTGLDEEDLDAISDLPGYVSWPMAVYGGVQFGELSGAFDVTAEARSAFTAALDRSRVVDCAPHLLRAWAGPMRTPAPAPDARGPGRLRGGRRPEETTVLCADFPPNNEVAAVVAETLSEMTGST